MTALDESVTNLQRFIAQLAAATGGLSKSTEYFNECGLELSKREDEAVEEGGGLNDELTELGSALDAGLKDSEQSLTEVAETAMDGQDTAAAARGRIEGTASETEHEAERTLSELADANARLLAQGFEALGQRLDAQQDELEAESGQLDEAFAQLETSLGENQTRAVEAWGDAEGELDASIGELARAESTLEAAAGEGVEGFETAAGELEQRCSDLASDVGLVYDALDAAVAEEGQGWEQHVASVGTETVRFVESGAEQRLTRPASGVEDEALPALQQEFAALGAVLEAATETAAQLFPLAEELGRCQSVVSQIAELMNALAG